VIAVDTNVLVYAHRAEMRLHEVALDRVRVLAEGNQPFAIPLFVIGEFVRVVTHPRTFNPPTTLEVALEYLDRLLGSPSARLLTPGPDFPALFGDACREAAAAGNLAFDAQLVAVCREHGVSELLTEDRDFSRFRGLSVVTLTA
jgi:toxin-antitoxin system PIN domain toxin